MELQATHLLDLWGVAVEPTQLLVLWGVAVEATPCPWCQRPAAVEADHLMDLWGVLLYLWSVTMEASRSPWCPRRSGQPNAGGVGAAVATHLLGVAAEPTQFLDPATLLPVVTVWRPCPTTGVIF